VFITAFGGVGAITTTQGYGVFPSSGFGFVSGLAVATLVYFFARFLYGQQASSIISTADLVGRTAEVSISIPENGVGQVRCLVGETVIDKVARSNDGGAIAASSVVKIEDVVGESVIVSPVPRKQPADVAPRS
jgi:hypothetical protein